MRFIPDVQVTWDDIEAMSPDERKEWATGVYERDRQKAIDETPALLRQVGEVVEASVKDVTLPKSGTLSGSDEPGIEVILQRTSDKLYACGRALHKETAAAEALKGLVDFDKRPEWHSPFDVSSSLEVKAGERAIAGSCSWIHYDKKQIGVKMPHPFVTSGTRVEISGSASNIYGTRPFRFIKYDNGGAVFEFAP